MEKDLFNNKSAAIGKHPHMIL